VPDSDFEAPLVALQKQIDELRAFADDAGKEAEARGLDAELAAARSRSSAA
jgi:hypothetical protein